MSGKRNAVRAAKALWMLIIFAVIAAVWGITFFKVTYIRERSAQAQLVKEAKVFLEDGLYVRAAEKYESAIKDYETSENEALNLSLMEIYREGGLNEKYDKAAKARIEAGKATVDEYYYYCNDRLSMGATGTVIPVLLEAHEKYNDERIDELYDQVKYRIRKTSAAGNESGIIAANVIPAASDGKWGYLSADGQQICDFVYDDATSFGVTSTGKLLSIIKSEGTYYVIDNEGNHMALDKTGFEDAVQFTGTRAVMKKDGKCVVCSNSLKPVSDKTFDNVILSSNGIIAVKNGEEWSLLDSEFQPVTNTKFADCVRNDSGQLFGNGYAVVSDGSGYFMIDAKGQACFDKRFPDAKGCNGERVAVKAESGKWGFINGKGEMVIEPAFNDAMSYSDGLAAVKQYDKWGYIDKNGRERVAFDYAEPGAFVKGIAVCRNADGRNILLTQTYYEEFQEKAE